VTRRFGLALGFLQVAAFGTLLRSIAFDRWITVLAAALLLIGAAAARRGKTWGVALAFAQAVAFPVAWMIGIAPAWFAVVGFAGALPFLLTLKSFAKFDKGATALMSLLAIGGGAGGAMLWKQYAWDVIREFPSLFPSIQPHHGLTLAALVGLALGSKAYGRKRVEAGAAATQHRVSESSSTRIALLEEDDEEEAVAPRLLARQHRSE
jgi:hypothetical protein